jgi:SAM-dependent methyltransferase
MESMNRVAEPYLRLNQVVNGFAAARVLQVAVELDLFSKLANEGKTAAQLSALAGVDPGALELLLNALTSLGFLRKEAERFFDMPLSHTYLSRSGPKYMGHFIRHLARGWGDWGRLDEAVRTGKPARKPDPIHESPRDLENFVLGMHELALARGDARWLARAISLQRCRKLLDLGGGAGTYAAMFCRAYKGLQAVVADLPATLKITKKILRDFDLTGRVSTLPMDYRSDAIKGGPYDVALVSNILHAETEATNRQLLRNVFEVLSPGGLLIVKDHVMSADHTEPETGALFALEMLLSTRGRTYSYAEIARWLEQIGFADTVEVPMEPPANVSLVLALRPGRRALVVLPRRTPKPRPPEPAADEPEPIAPPPAAARVLPRPARPPVRAAAAKGRAATPAAAKKARPESRRDTSRARRAGDSKPARRRASGASRSAGR